MEFGKLALLRRSVSDSAGGHPRIGFRRTSPGLSRCHPNSRGRDGWTGFPSRIGSRLLTEGIDRETFYLHLPSTCVRGAQGVLGRSHPYIFDRQLICGVAPAEELFLYASKLSSCRHVGYFDTASARRLRYGFLKSKYSCGYCNAVERRSRCQHRTDKRFG
jgi:hypothetical protein